MSGGSIRRLERSRSPLRADGLVAWVALSPQQVSDLSGAGAEPDPFSKRFGLRETPEAALVRASEFMGWRPHGASEPLHPKTFTLCRVHIPAAGYLHLMENGRLESRTSGEWRLYGWLKTKEHLQVKGVDVLLYEVAPEMHEII